MKVSYYVDEALEGHFVVIENVDGQEHVVGEYRFVEDAEEHQRAATERAAGWADLRT